LLIEYFNYGILPLPSGEISQSFYEEESAIKLSGVAEMNTKDHEKTLLENLFVRYKRTGEDAKGKIVVEAEAKVKILLESLSPEQAKELRMAIVKWVGAAEREMYKCGLRDGFALSGILHPKVEDMEASEDEEDED